MYVHFNIFYRNVQKIHLVAIHFHFFPYIARYDDSAYPQKRKNSENLSSPPKRRSSCVAVLTTDKEHRQGYNSQKNRLLERRTSGSSSSSRRSSYDNSSKFKSFDDHHDRRMSLPQQSLLGPHPDLLPGRSHSTPTGPHTITRNKHLVEVCHLNMLGHLKIYHIDNHHLVYMCVIYLDMFNLLLYFVVSVLIYMSINSSILYVLYQDYQINSFIILIYS